ncbi:MAG: gluconate:H+ symporter [Candidatus Marinimicrobia bacterium]|nr:gluconate:H+ symporter [Candidatus Neomarinimicrobiota bacterium]
MIESQLIGSAIAGIALLLYLIVKIKLHAFVALLIGSIVIGVGAGMPYEGVLDSLSKGIGNTLASIAVVVGLGAMFGRMLEVSGGAKVLADSLIHRFGEKNAQWSLMGVGFIIAIPVFFDVAFIILISLIYGLTNSTKKPIVSYALPLLAGLAVTHAFIPPTPGPIAVAGILGADLGWVMVFGIIIGLPSAIIAGPIYAKYISRRVPGAVPSYMDISHEDNKNHKRELPKILHIIILIAIPLGLIIANTISGIVIENDNSVKRILSFIGNPMVALLITTVLCFWILGVKSGYNAQEIQDIATKALEPAGIIILVTCAGGVLKQILIDSGIGNMFAKYLITSNLPPLLLAFITAVIIRITQGSATVAMLTASGLIASILGDLNYSDQMLALLVISIAAGATCFSHVNDSGFWLVNRYLGLSVPDTLKTWSVTTGLIGMVSILLILIISTFI